MKKLLFIFVVASLLLVVACQKAEVDEKSSPETVSVDYEKEVGISEDDFVETEELDVSELDELDELDKELEELDKIDI